MSIERRIGQIAARQRGLVRSDQLRRLGISRRVIEGRIKKGLLIPVLRGIYLVGVPVLDHAALRQAALLHAGPGASLSGLTAAEVCGYQPVRPGIVTVTTPRIGLARKVRTLVPVAGTATIGLVQVRQSDWLEGTTRIVDGCRVTVVGRSLIDIAASSADVVLDDAVRQAEFHGLLDIAELQRELSRAPRKGNAALRRVVDQHITVDAGPKGYKSLMEMDMLKVLAAMGIEPPAINADVPVANGSYELDLYWAWARLAVELDGWQGHRSRRAFEADPKKAADLLDELGILTLRFTWKRATTEPNECAQIIARQLLLRRPTA